MKTLFDLCTPRPDVLAGHLKDSDFAADLAQVLSGKAPEEYRDPALFFANTHPTQGLRALLHNVLVRLSGSGGEAASIFRLDTQYGGGKTHALIALSHAARGMRGVQGVAEFVDPKYVPQGRVRIAAFDGENADPVNGRDMGGGIRAFTPWGELAHALDGAEGYEAVRASDQQRVAPGAATIAALFGGEPTLILLDEISIYLRKVARLPDSGQFSAFLTGLFKAVESSPGAALVFTLAIGRDRRAHDAYAEENQRVAAQLEEAESVAARKATLLDPTQENETAQVLRRRLFATIDEAGAEEVIRAYDALWRTSGSQLPESRLNEDRAGELRAGYPFHPALIGTLNDKVATLGNFQRVRGMLRLLAQAVANLWHQRPTATYAMHLHHLDPGFGLTREEIVTRLEMRALDPAIRNDVSAPEGAASLAQQIDAKDFGGMAPVGSFVARTILWHTLAFNEHLKGASVEELRYAIAAPEIDLAFVNQARQKFVDASAYLDDRPGARLRFLTEANLTMIIRRQEKDVDGGEMRTRLLTRIRETFSGKVLNLVPFASGPYEVDDSVSDGRPTLVLLGYEAATVRGDSLRVPDLVERIFKQQGSQGGFRQLKNNLMFIVADEVLCEDMRAKMTRRMALETLRHPDRMKDLADHQQMKVQQLWQLSDMELATAVQQCYRHLFFPSRNQRIEGAGVDLAHTAFEVSSASETPGKGQQQVLRALADNQKLIRPEDPPPSPSYVRDQTPLKKGQISTLELRGEFRKDPRLAIMLGDEPFVSLVRRGIKDELYVYQSGELLCGPRDPDVEIRIDGQSFVYTMTHAKEIGVWPRAASYAKAAEGAKQTGGLGDGGTSGGGAAKAPDNKPPGVKAFTAEAPLREALTRVWEQARTAKVARISTLSLRVFDKTDVFRLLAAVGTVSGAVKRVDLQAEYETAEGGSFQMEFRGPPNDVMPIKEFLEPQLRAAKEPHLDATHHLTFTDGLALDGDAPEKLAEKLTRYATGAAFVEATATAAPAGAPS